MSAWRGGVAAGLVLVFSGGLAGCATVEIRDTRAVTGRVTDESGQPVPGSPVVVVGRSLVLATTRMEYEEQGRQQVQTTTDAQGHYRLEFIPATLGNNFYLFFSGQQGFDGVKYRRPESLDITELLRRDRTVVVNQVLQYAPTWREVERQIAFYGASSDRGKIIRKNGLPDRREPAGTGGSDSEVWWYDTAGISYWFTGDKLTSTHTFQPITPAPSR